MLADRIRMSVGKTKKLIDRTTPTLVVDQPYSTEGNGGRKLVRLDNGWLVAVVSTSDSYCVCYSKDKGTTWIESIARFGWKPSVSVETDGNYVYILHHASLPTVASTLTCRVYKIEGDSLIYSTGSNVDLGQSGIKSSSLAINQAGTELHACWSSKNSTYPDSFNIRYCKGIINTDGSVTWGNVERVTSINHTIIHNINPCILVIENKPLIIYVYETTNQAYYIEHRYKNVNNQWSFNRIYMGGTYTQSSPSACVDKDGVIHVAWSGGVGSQNKSINYAKSIDGGSTWVTKIPISSMGEDNLKPSISINDSGTLFIRHSRINNYLYKYKSEDGGNTWVYQGNAIGMSNPSLLNDNRLNFEEPLMITMTSSNNIAQPNSVIFSGKWYE